MHLGNHKKTFECQPVWAPAPLRQPEPQEPSALPERTTVPVEEPAHVGGE